MIYLDHNATTPLDERVLEVMLPYLTTFYGNPSSLYKLGRMARSAIDTAREQVAVLVDATPSQIIFTSGGTEANNLALNTALPGSNLAISAVEHPSIVEPVQKNKRYKDCFVLPVNEAGLVSLSALETFFQQTNVATLFSIMLANNETGAIQDVGRFARKLKQKQNIVHTDAIQAVGKIPVSFRQLGVDLLSISSHKIYGPKGSGALVVDTHSIIHPLFKGGGQEDGLRAGTENVAAIVGFGKAAELALLELEHRAENLLKLRGTLEQQLKMIPGLVIFAEQVERLPNTVQFAMPGVDGEMLLMQLDQNNIAVSSGSACTAGGGKASSVLTAMAVDFQLAKGAIRISLGKNNTLEEINEFIRVLKSLVLKSE
jgi:cysteine desulfurase